MKFKQLLTAVASTVMLSSLAFSASASLLTFNGQQVEALDLNGSVLSFEEFYDHNTTNIYSSNTGLEIVDTIVMFVAELNNEFGLFATISDANGGSSGAVMLSYAGTSGSMAFIDDPSETTGASSISFVYGASRSDGFIYSSLGDIDWSFVPTFSGATNLDGLQFVSFADGDIIGAEYSDLYSLDSQFDVSNQVSVNAPSALAMLLSGLFLILLRRKG